MTLRTALGAMSVTRQKPKDPHRLQVQNLQRGCAAMCWTTRTPGPTASTLWTRRRLVFVLEDAACPMMTVSQLISRGCRLDCGLEHKRTSSSGSGRTITIMDDLLEGKTVDRRRLVREETPIGQEEAEVEAEAEVQEEGRIGKIDEETVLRGRPLGGARVTDLGATVGSMRVTRTNRGTIRGRPLVGWARSSGPHWPQEKTESNGALDPLHRQGR